MVSDNYLDKNVFVGILNQTKILTIIAIKPFSDIVVTFIMKVSIKEWRLELIRIMELFKDILGLISIVENLE